MTTYTVVGYDQPTLEQLHIIAVFAGEPVDYQTTGLDGWVFTVAAADAGQAVEQARRQYGTR